jgi:hypothetical protein
MIRRLIAALERLARRAKPTCQCLLAYCPQMSETRPPLDAVLDCCGRWRDPQTARFLVEIIVATREEAERSLAEPRRQER